MFYLDRIQEKASYTFGINKVHSVVIQNDTFNRSRIRSTIVCTLTTNIKLANAPGNILLAKGDGNLSRDSVANISQILTVNKTDLLPESKIGKLSTEKIESIIAGLQIVF